MKKQIHTLKPGKQFLDFLLGFFGIYVILYTILLVIAKWFTYSLKAYSIATVLLLCIMITTWFLARKKKRHWIGYGVIGAMIIVILAIILAVSYIYLYSQLQ